MGWFVLSLFLFFEITSPQGLHLFREIQIKPPKSLQCYPSCRCPAERYLKRFLLFLKRDRHDKPASFGEMVCYLTSVLPQSEAIKQPLLLSAGAPSRSLPLLCDALRSERPSGREDRIHWDDSQLLSRISGRPQSEFLGNKHAGVQNKSEASIKRHLCCRSPQLDYRCDSQFGTCCSW